MATMPYYYSDSGGTTTAYSGTYSTTSTAATTTWTSTSDSVVYIYSDRYHDHYHYTYGSWDDEITWFSERVDPFNAKHYRRMQRKIDAEWSDYIERYYRNDNHAKEMQKQIDFRWGMHLREERRLERKKARELPEKTALKLLGSLIGEDELAVYKQTGRIFVKGEKGTYFAKKGGGVSKIEGKKIIDFCIHIKHSEKCPPTDHAIALKFMLEDDEKNVIKLANRMTTRRVSELPLAACM